MLYAYSSWKTSIGQLILSSLPTFSMCSVAVPVIVLENVDRARRHGMWRNYDKSKPLVA
jgi:hypothetical protein